MPVGIRLVLLILLCALPSSPSLASSSNGCEVLANIGSDFHRRHANAFLKKWEEARSGWMDGWHQWWGRRYGGFRDYIMPSQELFPWYFVASKDEAAAVIQHYLLEIQGRAVPVPKDQAKPIDVIQGWIHEYNDFVAKRREQVEQGFVHFFNERQFERALEAVRDKGLGEMDRVSVEVAVYKDGDVNFELITYAARDLKVFEKRNQQARYKAVGSQTMFPLFRSTEKALERGNFTGGDLFELEVKQAEVYRKLWMLQYRLENVKRTLHDNGRGHEFEPHQKILTALNRALGRTADGHAETARDGMKTPSARAMKAQLWREMWKQVEGWRSSKSDQDKTLKDAVLTGLLNLDNPDTLKNGLGLSDHGSARKLLKFLISPRTLIIGSIISATTTAFTTWWNLYKETVRPDLLCADRPSHEDFVACVNDYMKKKYGDEWALTRFNPDYVPFRDKSLRQSHRETLERFWRAREQELERRRREAVFQKPTEEGLEELKSLFEKAEATGDVPAEVAAGELDRLPPVRQQGLLFVYLRRPDDFARLRDWADIALDESRPEPERQRARAEADRLAGDLRGELEAYVAAREGKRALDEAGASSATLDELIRDAMTELGIPAEGKK